MEDNPWKVIAANIKEQKEIDKALGKVKKKGKSKWYLYALLCIAFAGVIVCGVGLGIELYTTWKSQAYYSEMSSDIMVRPRNLNYVIPSAPPAEPGTSEPVADAGNNAPAVATPAYEAEVWEPYVDFNTLKNEYPGISAWLFSEGTVLNYPIMHGQDNYFYLGHLPDGSRHRSGSVFLDYRNSADFTDKSMCIYGHESRTGDMFGSLKNYRKQDFYDSHPVMYIFTPTKDYALVLIAGYLLDSGVEVPPMKFKDDEAFLKHIDNIRGRSFFKSNAVVNANDRIVHLCTCAYDYTNARWIIVGKLVDLGPYDEVNAPEVTME